MTAAAAIDDAPSAAITFVVPGQPLPWKRAGTNGSHRYTPDEMAAHKFHVGYAAKAAKVRMTSGMVRLDVVAVFTPPASMSPAKRTNLCGAPVGKVPDWDNLGKLVSDALEGIAYENDRCVALGAVAKIWGMTPRTIVTITPLDSRVPLTGLPGMDA
jgi:Holliday junction resolvase RusA-like endonuclease